MIWTAYGPPEVLQLQDVPRPVPGDDQVLVRVHAATVSAGDCEIRSLKIMPPLGLFMRAYTGVLRPSRVTVLGQELAGEIVATGKDVTQFQPGDAVYAATDFAFGAYAEYAVLPAKGVALKPATMTYAEAATVPVGAQESLHFLRLAAIQPGDRVLINGAGGGIGTYGVQLAREFGAQVTAVDSAAKLEMLRGLGAERVFDYQTEDFTQDGPIYDVIFDIPGHDDLSKRLSALKPGGRYLLANPSLSQMVQTRWMGGREDKQIILQTTDHSAENLAYLRGLIEAGRLRAVIDRTYPLEQLVEAHRYVETGQKQGHVVIRIADEPAP
jgi:NADPH:quinone reductase-like Zn-dependent oxidoreductase